MSKKLKRLVAFLLSLIILAMTVTISVSAKDPDYRYRIRLEDYPYNKNAVVYLGAGEQYSIGVNHYSEGVEFFDLLAEGSNVSIFFTRQVDNTYSNALVRAYNTPNNIGDYIGVVSKRYAKGESKDQIAGNRYAIYTVFKVKPAPKTISLNKKSITLKVGQKYSLYEHTNSGSYANSQNLSWKSTNYAIVSTFKSYGNECILTAKKKGVVNVTVRTYNGKTATCRVTVV